MKRSNAPVLWALFGAGGMLAALIAPMLIFITGIAGPIGVLLPTDTLSFERMTALARNGFAKLALVMVVSLFMFHGGLRMFHSLHHLGFAVGAKAQAVIFGGAVLATAFAAWAVLAIGF